jgi:hypothetical protein
MDRLLDDFRDACCIPLPIPIRVRLDVIVVAILNTVMPVFWSVVGETKAKDTLPESEIVELAN